MRKPFLVSATICLGVFATTAFAQFPTAGQIDAEVAKIDAQRRSMFEQAKPDAKPTFPNIPTPARPDGNLDLDAIAKHYRDQVAAKRTDELMIFASLGMPETALRALLASARQAGAVVVLRGFRNNSVRETAQAVAKFGENAANVVVNPNAFQQYRVKAVPAVVLAKPEAGSSMDEEGCSLPETYTKVTGDVTLSFALEHVVKHDPEFAGVAKKYLRLAKAPL